MSRVRVDSAHGVVKCLPICKNSGSLTRKSILVPEGMVRMNVAVLNVLPVPSHKKLNAGATRAESVWTLGVVPNLNHPVAKDVSIVIHSW